jgi:hypothetical protein
VAADGYEIAAELAWTLPRDVVVIGLDPPRWTLFRLHAADLAGRTGLLVRSTRRGDDIDRTQWAAIEEVGHADRARDGRVIEGFRLFRVTGGAGATASAAILPRRASD